MDTHPARPLVLAIEMTFYMVTLISSDDPVNSEAILQHIPLSDGPPRSVRRVPIALLRSLIADEAAVQISEDLLHATNSRRAMSSVIAIRQRRPIKRLGPKAQHVAAPIRADPVLSYYPMLKCSLRHELVPAR